MLPTLDAGRGIGEHVSRLDADLRADVSGTRDNFRFQAPMCRGDAGVRLNGRPGRRSSPPRTKPL